MINQLILLALLISNINCHTPVNTSDIMIVGGHADMHENAFFVSTDKPPSLDKPVFKMTPHSDSDDDFIKHDEPKKEEEERKDEVVFVPTDKIYSFRNGEALHEDIEDTVKMSDVLENKRLDGLRETERPTGDVLFIQGKNSEKQDVDGRRRNDDDRQGEFKYIDDYDDTTSQGTTTEAPLDCTNLDCDNNLIQSLCGGRLDNTEMKYRLFKNECFFRKVNCGFSYQMNRYVLVDLEQCKHVGMHVTRRPYDYPLYFPIMESRHGRPFVRQRDEQKKRIERRFETRRAMTMNVGGSYCAHSCPTTCTEDYEPECALSAAGERRVFANHCQLDLNSCQFQMMWRRRPLAECTGGKKADMHQNRAFIDWMQRVGIVDNKGKLVLNS